MQEDGETTRTVYENQQQAEAPARNQRLRRQDRECQVELQQDMTLVRGIQHSRASRCPQIQQSSTHQEIHSM